MCFQLADVAAVNTLARELREKGIAVTEPQLYPEYTPDYYAFYFSDPDNIRLEVVCRTQLRVTIENRWRELVTFENPMAKLDSERPKNR